MATLEQVEKLREKANVSFEEAKAALEACNDDLLDAVIYLERQGKVGAPAGGGYYSSRNAQEEPQYQDNGGHGNNGGNCCGGGFRESMGRFGRFCAYLQHRQHELSGGRKERRGHVRGPGDGAGNPCRFLLLGCRAALHLSLFFGFRYRFVGAEIGTEQVNKVMDGASDTVEDIKRNFTNNNNGNNNDK